jgi:eukaryotic-like serine/threonine-protein kinase
MSTSSGSRDYGRFDELAEEFAERFRRGERPSLQEYVDRLPGMAEEIREMFPALVEVEQADGDARGDLVPPPPPVTPHLRQIGDYRILREVGRGGMGVVYEAEQISLGRRVAVKILLGQVVGDRKSLERFRREAKAAARLHHTNIVPVFEVGREQDVSFYAMQLIQGQGLEQVIDELRRLREPGRKANAQVPTSPKSPEAPATVAHARVVGSLTPQRSEIGRMAELLLSGRLVTEGPGSPATDSPAVTGLVDTERLDPDASSPREPGRPRAARPLTPPASESSSSAVLPGGKHVSEVDTSGRRTPYFRSVAQIGRQAAQGLAHAHARGVVHRDIKPSNLLLDTDGVVWITDFGLAKADDDGLTAPGDILGTLRYMAPERFRGQGDARADLYALGLTIYELLTLRPTYDSPDRLRLIEQVKSEEPTPPRSIDSRIPRDLETIVLKAIDKDPDRRYATADAMAEDLRRFLADEPIKARQISTSERYWRWARRNPVIATMGGVLTALLVAVTIGSLAAATHFRDSAQRESFLAGREKVANTQSQRDRKDAIEARRQAIEERDKSRQVSAGLALGKGIALGEAGHADRGLLWMLEALKTAPENATEFRRMVRWNLGAWLGQVHKPLRFIDIGGLCSLVEFSQDGRSLATAFTGFGQSPATPIDLWDTASGAKLRSLPGAFAPFAFRADGRVLVSTTEDRARIVAVDLATGRVLWTTPRLPGDQGNKIGFSPDGTTVLADRYDRSGGWLVRLDVVSGQPCGEPIRGPGWMAFTADHRLAATGRVENGEAYIDLFELPTGRRTASWRAGGLNVFELYFSPDGKSLFGSQRIGGLVDANSAFGQIWSTGNGSLTSPLMTNTGGAIYAPSADRLLTMSDKLWLVRGADGRVRGTGLPFTDLRSRPAIFGSDRDGRLLFAASDSHIVGLWSISPEAEPVADGDAGKLKSIADFVAEGRTRDIISLQEGLVTDGRVAVSAARGVVGREMIRLSDPATGRPVGRPSSHYPGWSVRVFALSPDGRCFASGSNPEGRLNGEVRLWDAGTGRLRTPPMPHTNWVSALAFQPDSKVLAAGDFHGLVRFWDTSAGREIGRPLPLGEIVLSLAYSPDGKVLAVGVSNDHSGKPGTRLWETTTRKPIGELLPAAGPVRRLEFRPDGRALLVGSERSTRLWDTTRGRALGEAMIEEVSGGFAPDGRTFLTSGGDGTIKLRDAETGAVLARLLTSASPATSAAFRGDGGLVAAGFKDGTVRLCDPVTAQPVGPPRFMRHAANKVAFTPDGRSVAAIDEFGESRTWPIPEPLPGDRVQDLTLRIEARTGLHMETGLAISRLDGPAWRDRLEQLRGLDPTAVEPENDPAWHEPMVREAEQNGNTFAALWHLDRLIASRPDDWFLYARRARASSLSDKFDKAAADYHQAERLGNREDVLDFQVHCVIASTKAERWAEALWYLDRLIAARPEDVSLHEDRATVYGKLGREADRQAELARVFELGADEALVIPRAEELGRAGRWAEAAGLLTRCGRKGPLSRELAQVWAIACLKAGDQVGYRETCAAVMAREGPNPTVVWNALSAVSLYALGAEGLDDYQVPIDWWKRVCSNPALPPVVRHFFSNALGGLLLRAGRMDEAIARLNEAMAIAKEVEGPGDWAYLALAHARKGNFGEARKWLDRLRSVQHNPRVSFWDFQELALLQSEAASLLADAEFPSDPFHAPSAR